MFNDLVAQGKDIAVLYLHESGECQGWGPQTLRHPHAFAQSPRADAWRVSSWLLTRRASRPVLASFGYRGVVRGAALLAARIAKVQILTRSDSNFVALSDESAARRAFRRLALRFAFPPWTTIWTIGIENERFWRCYVGRKRTTMIPYSVPSLPSSTGKKPRSRTSDPARLRFLFVGRLVPLKRVDDLIAAFEKLSAPDQRGWSLTIVGDGPEREHLEGLAAGDPRISLVGACDHGSLDRHYLTSDVLVLPSDKEAWGLVVSEAASFGLWIIVSDKCGARELVTHQEEGAVFPAGDRTSLAECLLASVGHLKRSPREPYNPVDDMSRALERLLSPEDGA